ncbi:MAG: DUF4347 domain-containing protein [Verrucomicrobia bacterium]|nr:DUF4347 domain-containing protein [Verrucomicrobiota bacterium]
MTDAATIDLTGSTANWKKVSCGNQGNSDFSNDQQSSAELDLVGNGSNPLLYTQYDDGGTAQNRTAETHVFSLSTAGHSGRGELRSPLSCPTGFQVGSAELVGLQVPWLQNQNDALIVADHSSEEIRDLLRAATVSVAEQDGSGDPLASITAELIAHRPRVLHLVAHGESGRIRFGDAWIDRAALIGHAKQLRQWNVETIALWSCRVGQDKEFVALLAELTGASVSASAEDIGHSGLSATWELNSAEGIGAHVLPPFNPQKLSDWNYTLATIYFNKIYKGTGTLYGLNSSSIDITTPLTGSSFRFTSADPNDTVFVENGNNTGGTIKYLDSSGTLITIKGGISRRNKAAQNNGSSCTRVGELGPFLGQGAS